MTTPLPLTQDIPHSFAPLLDRGYARSDFLRGLKTLIASAQERLQQEHDAGARGRNVVRHLTALVDDVVRTIWQYVVSQYPPVDEPCVLVALGGYGRGELHPFSDIDLMFLCHKNPPDDLIRDTHHLLWDVGYVLGHSVRTRRDVLTIAERDVTARTAMLEARFLEGDQRLFQWLQEDVRHRHFTPRRRRAFMRHKIAEYRQRHTVFANTVNLMEPNVKESPGGLRDYHTALWLGTAFCQADTLSALTEHDLLTSDDQYTVAEALDFLFRVRNALHYRYGRKNDLLAVDVQEPLATALGFTASANKLAVEQFLKTYYVHANVIFQSCRTVLEAVTHTLQPRVWGLRRRLRYVGDGFVIRNGYLGHEAPVLTEVFTEQPLLLMQVFRKVQEYHVALDPVLSRALKAHAPLLTTGAMRGSLEAKDVFFHILAQPHAASVLREMHRHGVLNAYIPEFAALTCLPSYDLYHRYTVDEHTLLSIEQLESLAETQEPSLKPFAQLYAETEDQALLKFALLLHDLGKDIGPGKASHVHRSGELAEPVCERMGLHADQRHRIQILIVHHLAMNRLAQRRDVTDEKVATELASMVETVPNLEQLYLLTYADTSAVGPDVWTVWKGTLLAELYRRTLDYLIRQRPVIAPSDEELRQRLHPAMQALLPQHRSADEVEHFLAVMPARYLMATPPPQMVVHLGLMQAAQRATLAFHAEQHTSAGFSRVTICLAEGRGVFSLIAGALSRNKLNILRAQIYTSSNALALDILEVETLERTPVTDPRVWQKVEADLCAALANEDHLAGVLTQRRSPIQERKRQAVEKPLHVIINNASSDTHTIIEIQAEDGLGLLYRLTHLLYEQGLDIALAKISTEGSRAIDVFYVTDARGQKIEEEEAAETLRQALCTALS